jgi:Flp pilus assembly pilin Flp
MDESCPALPGSAILAAMSRLPTNRSGENFIEFALIIILLAIVMLSILLIVGDSIRVFLNDIGIRWSLLGNEGAMLPALHEWFA